MAKNSLEKLNNCLINTGNILSLNDITRKSGQTPADELLEAINITLNEYRNETSTILGNIAQSSDTGRVLISRQSDDLSLKISEQPLQDLKIGLKIFLNTDTKVQVQEAFDQGNLHQYYYLRNQKVKIAALATLKVPSVHHVIIVYNNKQPSEHDDCIENLKKIWLTLEENVKNEKINQIGIADVEETVFRKIYDWANIKPTIIQINLATCCVVPPTLQQFCKDMDIQLLTHADPIEILSNDKIENLFKSTLTVKWVLRFLVHIKCRGVLITKGYLINLSND